MNCILLGHLYCIQLGRQETQRREKQEWKEISSSKMVPSLWVIAQNILSSLSFHLKKILLRWSHNCEHLPKSLWTHIWFQSKVVLYTLKYIGVFCLSVPFDPFGDALISDSASVCASEVRGSFQNKSRLYSFTFEAWSYTKYPWIYLVVLRKKNKAPHCAKVFKRYEV